MIPNHSISKQWPRDITERLVHLWNEGQSCSEIAASLGGLSRNTVIGKVTRLRAQGVALREGSLAETMKRTRAGLKGPRKVRAVVVARAPVRATPKSSIVMPKAPKKAGFKFGISTAPQASKQSANGTRVIAAFEAQETGKGLRLLDLTSRFQCRAPMGGHGENMLFCAEPITDGVQSSYCTTCRPRFVLGSVDAKELMRSLRKAYA